MRKADLQQQAVELIKHLSTEKLKAGIDYLNYFRIKKRGQPHTNWRAIQKSPRI